MLRSFKSSWCASGLIFPILDRFHTAGCSVELPSTVGSSPLEVSTLVPLPISLTFDEVVALFFFTSSLFECLWECCFSLYSLGFTVDTFAAVVTGVNVVLVSFNLDPFWPLV